ncbi:MAG: MetQ/NlpA family ABC transporter substrate-binding protein [Acetobacteraceae bacterium]|nr:MetQ/NlpA family ABC transporter substrate-binding protein [Acetobacteraceae bacterium]
MSHFPTLSRRTLVAAPLILVAGGAIAREAPLRIGVTAGPYAEILNYAAGLARAQGIESRIYEFSDFTMPNEALFRGDLDANNYQHRPYLENANRTRGYDLVPLASSIVVPMGLYSRSLTSTEALPDRSQVALPNDPSNGARALQLLERAKLLRLRDGAGVTASVADIVENPKRLRFLELDAAQLPRSLDDVKLAAITMNYAVPAGLDPRNALLLEAADTPWGLVWVARAKDRENARLLRYISIYRSPEVKQFIAERFGNTILPTW